MDSDKNDSVVQVAYAAMQRQTTDAYREWTNALAGQCPQVADQLRKLHERQLVRRRKLEALLVLFVANTNLPIEKMYVEYSALLDSNVGGVEQPAAPDGSECPGPHQRAAQTKRERTRRALVAATVEQITRGVDFRIDDIARVAGVSVPTLYNYFSTKEELMLAAYEHLLEPVFAALPT
jgi:hypothetical protein